MRFFASDGFVELLKSGGTVMRMRGDAGRERICDKDEGPRDPHPQRNPTHGAIMNCGELEMDQREKIRR